MGLAKKVSVCVPVYNGEQYLIETIESIRNQTYQNIEIIVQNNCSTDSTGIILSELIKADNRINIRCNPELVSMAKNWNNAVSRASGDYVLLLSADDILKPKFIAKCVAILEEDLDVNFVSTEHHLLTGAEIKARRIKAKPGKRIVSSNEVLLKNPFSINFTLFRKEYIQSISLRNGLLFREPYFTCDYDLWLKASLEQSTVYFLAEPLAIYRVHGDALSNNKLKMLKHTVLVLTANKDWLCKDHKLIYKITLIRMLARLFILYVKSGVFNIRLTRFISRQIYKK